MPLQNVYRQLMADWTSIGASAQVTKRALLLTILKDPETGWYTTGVTATSVNALIIPKGLKGLVLSHGLFIQYDSLGLSESEFQEDDELLDKNGNYYRVMAVTRHQILGTVQFYELQMSIKPAATGSAPPKWEGAKSLYMQALRALEQNTPGSGTALRYPLSLGAKDSETGWYASDYGAPEIVHAIVNSKASKNEAVSFGFMPSKPTSAWTLDTMGEGDKLLSNSRLYKIETVTPQFLGEKLAAYELAMEDIT